MKFQPSKEGFFTEELHGLRYEDIKEFKDETVWLDSGLNYFFRHAIIDTHFQSPNYTKEILSKFFAITLLVIFAPILICIIVGIKLTMNGNVFYRQTRVGKDGQLFDVIKFTSMIENAEESTGHTLSWDGDPRITKFGSFLRKSHLDELPQLVNVLKGDMYFIGPRPERPEFTNIYDVEIADYSKRHVIKPGITGLAQIACPYDATAAQKLKYDIMYLAFRDSAVLNILIAFHTAKKMVIMSKTANILQTVKPA